MICPQFSILAEVEWTFEDDDVNWRFCMEHATFAHEAACEFIIHIGDGRWIEVEEKMQKFGCTSGFIDAYVTAKDAGATRVMFWS